MKSKISIILFLITTTIIYSQSDVKVLSSDFNSITIEYSPVYVDTTIKMIEGKTYRNIELFLGTLKNSEKWGFPSILERKLNVGVPTEFGTTIEILSTFYKEISGHLIPVPYPVED